MISTSRLAWIVGVIAMTFGYLFAICHHFDYSAATLTYGPFMAGTKAWEKFLSYRYGAQNG